MKTMAVVEVLRQALAWGESEIRNEYEGTGMLQKRLNELDFLRRATKELS